jgi:protein-disulfide isomerase
LTILLGCQAIGQAKPGDSIPWKRLPGAADLLQNERETAAKVMRSVKHTHRCTLSIARCLASKPEIEGVWRLARYVIYLAGKGLDEKDIVTVLDRRRKSLFPEKVAHIPITKATPPLVPSASKPKLVIVEYADFRCGHCANLSPLLTKLVQRSAGKVALHFKPFPLRSKGPSVVAARAVLAAGRQGKFWPMARLLFRSPQSHTEAGVLELARRGKLDVKRFAADFKDPGLARLVGLIRAEAKQLGVKATPTLFFNGKRFLLPADERHLTDRIADGLELAGK